MCTRGALKLFVMTVLTVVSAASAAAQAPPSAEPEGAQPAQAGSRQAAIEQEQASKATNLQPYKPDRAETLFRRLDTLIEGGTLRWHPFFDSAYSGGGFTLGVGHASYLSAYNYLDVRGSYTITGYKRAEAEFVAPRMFNRRGHLSVLAGWREATQVGFYGIGQESSKDDRTNYLFQRPYGSALLTVFRSVNSGGSPFRRHRIVYGLDPVGSRWRVTATAVARAVRGLKMAVTACTG